MTFTSLEKYVHSKKCLKQRRQLQEKHGRFATCHFWADILQVYKFWTQIKWF